MSIFLTYTRWSLPVRIFWMIFATSLSAIIMGFVILNWMAGRIDTVTQDKSIVLIESALNAEIARMSTLTRDYGFWDGAYEWFTARDGENLYDNLGISAAEEGTFDGLYLIAADGSPQYAYIHGEEGSNADQYPHEIGDQLRDMVRALPAVPYQSVDHFAIVDGVLTIFVGARLQPSDISGIDPLSLPMLIGVRTLNDDALADLGANIVLQNLGMIGPDAALPRGTSNAQVTGLHGDVIGQMVWDTERPGAQLIRQTAPYLTIIAGLMLLISLYIARTFAQQTQIYVTEHTNARTDQLTGLLNRAGLDELVQSKEVQLAISRGRLAVIFADLNNLKALNDTHGHDAGDEALRITANRIRAAVRTKDSVARVGGDEFVCILMGPSVEEYAKDIMTRMNTITHETMMIDGSPFRVAAAVGYAVSESSDDWDSVLARADKAMFVAKRKRKAAQLVPPRRSVSYIIKRRRVTTLVSDAFSNVS